MGIGESRKYLKNGNYVVSFPLEREYLGIHKKYVDHIFTEINLEKEMYYKIPDYSR